MFSQITIIGPGLLGASLALAVKSRGLTKRIHIWSRRAETRAQALNTSWCEAAFDTPQAAVTGSKLVVICTPVDTIAPILESIAPSLDADAIVTDVGSTKSLICRTARGIGGGSLRFIGSHPMAGSEQTGMTYARGDLFENAACILTPLEDAVDADIAQLRKFWESIGMEVVSYSPEKHDEIVAHVSHLPHLLASTLCSYLADQDPEWQHLSGGGLRDTTRVASGDVTLWKQILEQNREEVIRSIEGFEEQLNFIKSALLNSNSLQLKKHLQSGKNFRDHLRQRS